MVQSAGEAIVSPISTRRRYPDQSAGKALGPNASHCSKLDSSAGSVPGGGFAISDAVMREKVRFAE